MKKTKLNKIRVAALLFAIVICGGFLVSCDRFGYGTIPQTEAPSQSSISSFDLEKLAMIEKLYKENFVGEIDYDKMTDALISAYIAAAGDEFGVYFNSEDYKTYSESMSAEFSGIGVNVIYNIEYRAIEIVNVFRNSPADKGGVSVGDLIITVGEEKTPVETSVVEVEAAAQKADNIRRANDKLDSLLGGKGE